MQWIEDQATSGGQLHVRECQGRRLGQFTGLLAFVTACPDTTRCKTKIAAFCQRSGGERAQQIHAPFRWRCESACCGREYQRHSNSIDVARDACGECGGSLVFLGRVRSPLGARQACVRGMCMASRGVQQQRLLPGLRLLRLACKVGVGTTLHDITMASQCF